MSTGWYPYDKFAPGDGDDVDRDEEEISATENTDELIARMLRDEIDDAPLITPVNYSKIRPIKPQLVYYAIKTKKIATHVCPCGRTCIDKAEADRYYRKRRGALAWPYGTDEDEDSSDDGSTQQQQLSS